MNTPYDHPRIMVLEVMATFASALWFRLDLVFDLL